MSLWDWEYVTKEMFFRSLGLKVKLLENIFDAIYHFNCDLLKDNDVTLQQAEPRTLRLLIHETALMKATKNQRNKILMVMPMPMPMKSLWEYIWRKISDL